MPAAARTKPSAVAKSGFAPGPFGFALGSLGSAIGEMGYGRRGQDFAAELDYLRYDFFGAFEHDELLAVGEADHRVRRGFDVLDQIRVEDHGHVIHTS